MSLKYALDSLFVAKSAVGETEIWLILAILQTLMHLIDDATVVIGRNEAFVLLAIYRLRSATVNRIKRYITDDLGIYLEPGEQIDVKKSITNLENIGTISMEEGKYVLNEIVKIK